MSKDAFTLKYLSRAAAGVPRDLVNSVVAKVKPIRPTVLIYNCTFVCDARCQMCNNWTRGNRKQDMTLDQIDQVFNNRFWGAIENLNISGGEPTTRNDLP
jgi:molybdenum cofactor biosynthesis enzyme MoaA